MKRTRIYCRGGKWLVFRGDILGIFWTWQEAWEWFARPDQLTINKWLDMMALWRSMLDVKVPQPALVHPHPVPKRRFVPAPRARACAADALLRIAQKGGIGPLDHDRETAAEQPQPVTMVATGYGWRPKPAEQPKTREEFGKLPCGCTGRLGWRCPMCDAP